MRGLSLYRIIKLRQWSKLRVPFLPTGSFRGRTVVIAGATDRTCSEVARILVTLEVATLVIGVRHLEKGQTLAAECMSCDTRQEREKTRILVLPLHMSSFQSVREFCSRVKLEEGSIDNLIMGSVKPPNEKRPTRDGWDESMSKYYPVVLCRLAKCISMESLTEESSFGCIAHCSSLASSSKAEE